MEVTEVKDLLGKMGALIEDEQGKLVIDSAYLMQDPIVTNRFAVELLQKLDRELKPEAVVCPAGLQSYFGYSVALTAWMRFLIAEEQGGVYRLQESCQLKKKEKVVIVLDTYDQAKASALLDLVSAAGAKPVAIVSLVGIDFDGGLGCPLISLL